MLSFRVITKIEHKQIHYNNSILHTIIMNSKSNHAIAKRNKNKKANDVFITPLALAKKHIKIVAELLKKVKWDYSEHLSHLDTSKCKLITFYDPFRNSGSYYNQYPDNVHKEWAEILEGRDFFTHQPSNPFDMCIISNCPYSIINAVLARSIELRPKIISYLLGMHNLTAKRLEVMEFAGYVLAHVQMCKVYKWFGMSFICTWIRTDSLKEPMESAIHYDRTIWKLDKNRKSI
jgi:hypothetical protein